MSANEKASDTGSPAPQGASPVGGIPRSEWKWYGHAAHLIVGQSCRFHLATEVGEYLVSTVGEYWPERRSREISAEIHDPRWLAKNRHRKGDDFDWAYMKRFGYEAVGADRKYETMVFRIASHCDAKECGCGLPQPSDWSELDFDGYNGAAEARAGHLAMCEKWAALSSSPAVGGEMEVEQ